MHFWVEHSCTHRKLCFVGIYMRTCENEIELKIKLGIGLHSATEFGYVPIKARMVHEHIQEASLHRHVLWTYRISHIHRKLRFT